MSSPARSFPHPDHAYEPIVEDPDHPGRYLAACRCGDYAVDLESKRAGRRWQTRHLQATADLSAELATPAGRGRLAAIARKRGLAALANAHPTEAARLENVERMLLGLTPLPLPLVRPTSGHRP